MVHTGKREDNQWIVLAGCLVMVVAAGAAPRAAKPCHDGHGRVDLRDVYVVGKHLPDCSVG